MTTKTWSKDVTDHSDALDLPPHLFEKDDPKAIARLLKRSAEQSGCKKGTPFQSSMSMLTFDINRAGKGLPEARKRTLEPATDERRALFDRPRPSN